MKFSIYCHVGNFWKAKEIIIPSSFAVISLRPSSGIGRGIFQGLQVIIIVLKKMTACVCCELCTFIGNMQIRAHRGLHNNSL